MTRNLKIAAAVLVALFVAIMFFVFSRSKGDGQEAAPADEQKEAAGKTTVRAGGDLPHVDDKAPEKAPPEKVECKLKPCAGPVCDKCVNENCESSQAGCQAIKDDADRKLCEELYTCFSDPTHDCTYQGDPLKCWCGTNPTTCLFESKGPGAPNGVCAKLVYLAAKTNDPQKIRERFTNPEWPIGRAVNLTTCRGGFCPKECSIK